MGYYDRMLRTLQMPSTNGGIGTGLGLAAIGAALSNISKISDNRAKAIAQQDMANQERAYKDTELALAIEKSIQDQAQRNFENNRAIKKDALDEKLTNANIDSIKTNSSIAKGKYDLAKLDNLTKTRLIHSAIKGDKNSALFAHLMFGTPLLGNLVPSSVVNKDKVGDIEID